MIKKFTLLEYTPFFSQVLHGCRQLVSWDVGLSSRTSATLVWNYKYFSQTASDRLEEGEDDVKSARPLWAGLHAYYNGNDNRKQEWKLERILKPCLSSDCCLQLDNMKLESLVIADQHAAVNPYLSFVHTARHAPEIHGAWCFKDNKNWRLFWVFGIRVKWLTRAKS